MKYIGEELNLFENATNWKVYFSKFFSKYISGNVLEVGAGVGGSSVFLQNSKVSQWTCLEPDASLLKEIERKIEVGILPNNIIVRNGFVKDLTDKEEYDTIIYIDIIEHIADEGAELIEAWKRLKKGGSLILLSPAHNYLFTPFDKSVGHYRRYDKQMIRGVIPFEMDEKFVKYLDSLGFFASLANKLILRKSNPSLSQIMFWDKVLVPISKFVDKLLFYQFGKTIIGVWKK